MSDISFFTDEDVHGELAEILRSNGFDAISVPEAGRLTGQDPDHLDWCSGQGRVIVTFSVRDFASLHKQWLVAGRRHPGIIASDQRPIGDLARRVLRLARTLTAEEMIDRLEYLSDWPSAWRKTVGRYASGTGHRHNGRKGKENPVECGFLSPPTTVGAFGVFRRPRGGLWNRRRGRERHQSLSRRRQSQSRRGRASPAAR